MLRSRNTSSGSRYQPVETSEYEILEHEGLDADANEPPLPGSWPDPNSHISSPDLQHWASSPRASHPSAYDEDLVQTISRADSVTLSHPTPGSSSINGSNFANIERLEISAQRLSLSEDIGEELRKLQAKQKRDHSRKSSVRAKRQFSTNSQQNSIVNVNSVARSGGFSPEAYVASPTGSIMSPYSLQSAKSHSSLTKSEDASRVIEPVKEGRPLDFPPSPESKVLTVRNSTEQDSSRVREEEDSHLKEPLHNQSTDRPNSAASGDTFRRAHDAFANFDGVHIPSDTPEIEDENHVLLDRGFSPSPPLDDGDYEDPQGPYVPPDHEELIYYPAPVPMMLNLPAKLSKGPSAAEIAKRRSAILRGTHEAGQSVSDLGALQGQEDEGMEGTSRKRASKVPPQLRASAYFDQAPVHPDLQITGGSASQTLEAILDHSAYAPVTAFTDHPMIGREGAEVYNSSKTSNSQKNTSAKRGSTQALKPKRRGNSFFAFGAKLRGISKPVEDEEPVEEVEGLDSHEQAAEEEEEDNDDEVPLQRPATLLAELQIRKAQQKQRNRTAATAFPNGMHSTLLQLDAVAQVQKQARKQKQISLAWEDNRDADDDPDEDVPLGVLFPGSKPQHEDSAARYPEDRPLGLLAQRNLEEQEPLSQRKSRLHSAQNNSRLPNQRSMINLGSKGNADPPQLEDEEETLGQRRRRLRGDQATEQPRPLSSDFASGVLSQLGVGKEQEKRQVQSKTPDPEETLGQRKKRLQAEKTRQANAQVSSQPVYGAAATQKRRSMADLLQSNPIGVQQKSYTHIPGTSPSGLINTGPQPRHASTFQLPTMERHAAPLIRSKTDQQPYPQQPQSIQYPNPMAQYAQFYGNNVNAMGVGGQYYAAMPEQPPLPPQQRAMIDRWRQSVV